MSLRIFFSGFPGLYFSFLPEKKTYAGQRISNKLLKKNFFIHLFFPKPPQYEILYQFSFKIPKIRADPSQKKAGQFA